MMIQSGVNHTLAKVVRTLIAGKLMTRSEIFKKCWQEFNTVKELDKMLSQLKEAQMAEQASDGRWYIPLRVSEELARYGVR